MASIDRIHDQSDQTETKAVNRLIYFEKAADEATLKAKRGFTLNEYNGNNLSHHKKIVLWTQLRIIEFVLQQNKNVTYEEIEQYVRFIGNAAKKKFDRKAFEEGLKSIKACLRRAPAKEKPVTSESLPVIR